MMFRQLLCLSTLLVLGTRVRALLPEKPLDPVPDSPDAPDFKVLQFELGQNRLLWKTNVGGSSYQMTITRQCFCIVESLGPFTLTVVNKAVANINPDNEFSDSVPTIEELFALIQDAINDKVAKLTVSYDATLGFPTNVYIDRDFRIADEEIGYEVKDVMVLKKGKLTFDIPQIHPNNYSPLPFKPWNNDFLFP